jgi:hypothetical protein
MKYLKEYNGIDKGYEEITESTFGYIVFGETTYPILSENITIISNSDISLITSAIKKKYPSCIISTRLINDSKGLEIRLSYSDKRGFSLLQIFKDTDEWYYVYMSSTESNFKCDQTYGLKSCLLDNTIIKTY